MPSFIEAKHEECPDCMDTWTPAVGKAPAEPASAFFVRVDIYNNATAERDTAKEIIKELVSAAQGLAASRTYNPEILRDLLARAKELLK